MQILFQYMNGLLIKSILFKYFLKILKIKINYDFDFDFSKKFIYTIVFYNAIFLLMFFFWWISISYFLMKEKCKSLFETNDIFYDLLKMKIHKVKYVKYQISQEERF